MSAPADRLRLAAAFTLPPACWAAYEYGAAGWLRTECQAVGTWIGPGGGIAALLGCALAAWLAWPLLKTEAVVATPTRRWLALIAAMLAALFSLAILFQLLATLIVPPCVR